MKSMAWAVLVVLAASWARAESLAEAAKRERERREKNKKSGVETKVVDADELARTQTKKDGKGTFNDGTTGDSGGSSSSSGSASSSASTAGTGNENTRETKGTSGPAATTSESDKQAAKEALWREKLQAARARLETARKRLANTSPTMGVPGVERTQVLGPDGMMHDGYKHGLASVPNPDYARAEAEVAAAEKAIPELEEQARRAGALPGWLR